MAKYEKNDYVEWNWGDGQAFGQIKQVYTEEITRTIEGSKVTREASKSNPAYFIHQVDGDGKVLKSHSEVKPVTKSTVYELAKSESLDGRSDMTKEELLNALT